MKFVTEFQQIFSVPWQTLVPPVHGNLLVLVASLLYV
jgi:hypothetical protein